ncbi:MAG: hypothetical protein U0871_29060 [Gemmataceae bacterium]
MAYRAVPKHHPAGHGTTCCCKADITGEVAERTTSRSLHGRPSDNLRRITDIINRATGTSSSAAWMTWCWKACCSGHRLGERPGERLPAENRLLWDLAIVPASGTRR